MKIIHISKGLIPAMVAALVLILLPNYTAGQPDSLHSSDIADIEEELQSAASKKDGLLAPDATYMFCRRDSIELNMDVYEPAAGSETTLDGQEKPAILFVFGGGFKSGRRDSRGYNPWFKAMTEEGYRVISIDYRLGLKGATAVGIRQVKELDYAIHLAVEDLFSATAFIIENEDAFGIDSDNIVLCGSSAGAITILQAEYELCNRTSYADILPSDFQYAGLLSFSGGILSHQGKLKYAEAPCPTLLFHGTKDKLVNYKQIKVFKLGFFGSCKIAERLEKFGYNYNVRRYLGCGHEVAEIMDKTVNDQTAFIEENIMKGTCLIVDSTVSDPRISSSGTSQSRKELYGK